MLASTSQFAAMIEGREQVVTYDVSVDLPGGIYPSLALAVTDLEIDASVDSDMPQGTRLEEGFSAVSGSFTVSGRVDPDDETKTAAWLLGRYPTKAADGTVTPLVHTDLLMARVEIILGLYPDGAGDDPEQFVKLVGKVEDYGREGEAVTFNVIDLRQDYRGSVETAAVITAPPFNAGMTNEFVVDYLLRRQSGGLVSSWPAIRPQCVLAVGFRSSPWAEVGTLNASQNQPDVSFGPGLMGSALVDATPSVGGWDELTYDLESAVGTALFAEWWQPDDPSSSGGAFVGTSPTGEGIGLDRVGDTFSVVLTDASGDLIGLDSWTAPTGSGVYTAFKVTLPAVGGNTYTVTYRAGATSHTSGPHGMTSARTSLAWDTGETDIAGGSVEGMQVTTEASPAFNDTFTPRAVLDPSFNRLLAVPKITGDGWRAIQDLAASELAVAGFEGDVFRYLNRRTLAQSSTVRTITSDDALLAIAESSSSAGIVNRAQIGWTPWTFDDARSTVWEATSKIRVPAHDTYTTTVQLDGYACNVDSGASLLPDLSGDTTQSFFRASRDPDGLRVHPGVTVTLSQPTPDSILVTAVNDTGLDAWLVSPATYSDVLAGTVLLRVAAQVVTQGEGQLTDYQWPPASSGGAAGSRFGELPFVLSGNQWLQVEDCAIQLGKDIVAASCVPRPDLIGTAIRPDPRIQRCDRARFVDSASTGIDAYALIFGYKITYQAGGGEGGGDKFEMTVDGRAIAPPGGWIGGVEGASEGGVTTYGY